MEKIALKCTEYHSDQFAELVKGPAPNVRGSCNLTMNFSRFTVLVPARSVDLARQLHMLPGHLRSILLVAVQTPSSCTYFWDSTVLPTFAQVFITALISSHPA